MKKLYKEHMRFFNSMNDPGKFVITYLMVNFAALIGGLFHPFILQVGFAMFVLGMIPCCIIAHFIKFDHSKEED